MPAVIGSGKIEIFRTNVANPAEARTLVEQIRYAFPGYRATFDLEDVDRILRIESPREFVEAPSMIQFLDARGCKAEVLPDVIKSVEPFNQ